LQSIEGQFETDLEEKEDDADLRQRADTLGVGQQAEDPGPGDRACEQAARNGGEPQSPEQREPGRGEAEQEEDFEQEQRVDDVPPRWISVAAGRGSGFAEPW